MICVLLQACEVLVGPFSNKLVAPRCKLNHQSIFVTLQLSHWACFGAEVSAGGCCCVVGGRSYTAPAALMLSPSVVIEISFTAEFQMMDPCLQAEWPVKLGLVLRQSEGKPGDLVIVSARLAPKAFIYVDVASDESIYDSVEPVTSHWYLASRN